MKKSYVPYVPFVLKKRLFAVLLTVILIATLISVFSSCKKSGENKDLNSQTSDEPTSSVQLKRPITTIPQEPSIDFSYEILYGKQQITYADLNKQLASGQTQTYYNPEKFGDLNDVATQIETTSEFNKLLKNKEKFFDNYGDDFKIQQFNKQKYNDTFFKTKSLILLRTYGPKKIFSVEKVKLQSPTIEINLFDSFGSFYSQYSSAEIKKNNYVILILLAVNKNDLQDIKYTEIISHNQSLNEFDNSLPFNEAFNEINLGCMVYSSEKPNHTNEFPHAYMRPVDADSNELTNTTATIIITDYNMLLEINENKSIASSHLSKYDEEYFKDRAVILHFKDYSSGSIKTNSVKSITKDGNVLKIMFSAIYREYGDTAFFFSSNIIEVNKSDVADIEDVKIDYITAGIGYFGF